MNSILDRKIAQQARRGLLELDIIRHRFLTLHYTKLSLEDKQSLLAFLQFSDIDLLNWVTGEKAGLPEYQHLVDQLSACKYPIHDTSS